MFEIGILPVCIETFNLLAAQFLVQACNQALKGA